MKTIKLFTVALFASTIAVAGIGGGLVSAQGNLYCTGMGQEFPFNFNTGCDLSIVKEVSVDGASFLDANLVGEAAQGVLGNSVVWRVTVSDSSETDVQDYWIDTTIRVYDVLPVGVTYQSHSTSDGTFDSTTGTWEFTLSSSTTYPLTLTINTTAETTGQVMNNAYLSGNFCDGWCEYSDANFANNSDDAWIEISAAPVVLGESTPQVLAATGSGLVQSLIAGMLILVTIGILGYSKFARKNS